MIACNIRRLCNANPERSYEQRELPLIHLNVGCDWDEVRDHPRFQNILRQMKFLP